MLYNHYSIVFLYDVCSSTHLSAILAHIGLASHHCPDVVIQPPIKCDTE